jgi:hypothetical protein
MSECDNWEKRKKMLEENGCELIFGEPFGQNQWAWMRGARATSEYKIKKINDSTFLDFIDTLIADNKLTKQDAINHPAYYTDGKIEVSDFIADKNLNFFRGNVVKYVARAGKKDPAREVEDLKKAQWYINREIERLEGKAK